MKRYENAIVRTRWDIEESVCKDKYAWWGAAEQAEHDGETKEISIKIKRAIAEMLRRKKSVAMVDNSTAFVIHLYGKLYGDPNFPDGGKLLSQAIKEFRFEGNKLIAVGVYEEYEVDFGFKGFDPVKLKALYPDKVEMKKEFPFGLDASCEAEHQNTTKHDNEEAYLAIFTEI